MLVVHLRALTDKKVLQKMRGGSVSSLWDACEDERPTNSGVAMRKCFPTGKSHCQGMTLACALGSHKKKMLAH